MLIVMKPNHTEEQRQQVIDVIDGMGYVANVIPGEHSVAIGITGNKVSPDPAEFLRLQGVDNAIPVSKPYKLASRDFKQTDTIIEVGNAVFGGSNFVVIGGPCAVESDDQTRRIAKSVHAAGATVLRGGAYKPRSSPYAFQGLGKPGLEILKRAKADTGLPIITEALDLESLEYVNEYADIIQIGTRNMQNFSLLKAAGQADKPVMLKRGFSSTIDEWLQAAEYLMDSGNKEVILCERGIRSFDKHTRNLLDLAAVVVLKELTHLPVMVDPSHGSGRKDMVDPLSRGALAIGAHSIIVDVHDKPEEALCDGPQALLPEEFSTLVDNLQQMAPGLGIKICENTEPIANVRRSYQSNAQSLGAQP